MSKNSEQKSGGIAKLAAFIVDKRKGIYLVYIVLGIFCFFSMNWTQVNNTLSDYLGDETETRKGLDVMDAEFTTYATAQVMVDNISYSTAEGLCEELEEIKGVKEIAFDDTTKHYSGASALFSVTFDGLDTDEICTEALDNIKERLSDYDTYVSAELGDTKAQTIAKEINVVMIIACVIIVSVLLFTSRTYMEVPVLIITFAMAALLNKGSNFLFGTISFVSDSIAVVLQLALAIDYAIILCHRYTEERLTNEPREAVIIALQKAIPEIAGSCLTTISGLAAMTFMHFKIGYDMGIILIKAIFISILTVFTLMPGLVYSFSSGIDKTHHKSFVPQINVWGRFVYKMRIVMPIIMLVIVAACAVFSQKCPYVYSYTNLSTFRQNESQIASHMIDDTFTTDNVLAVIVPTGDYGKEKNLCRDLEKFDEVDSVTGLAGIEAKSGYYLGDALTPRQFSELADIDIELARLAYGAYAVEDEEYGKVIGGIDSYSVPLIDMFDFIYDQIEEGAVTLDDDLMADIEDLHEQLVDGKKQLKGENHSRIVLNLNIPEESDETFAFLETVRGTAAKYYGDDVLLAGNSTSDFDLSSTFGGDNTLISVLSVVFVMLILLFTFQSAGIPVILILVIQGSVWMNFSFPYLQNSPLFFLSYLVVSSIQMGANIDYAIVITNRYMELRQQKPPKEAVIEALNLAFPTIFTSGTILASAGIAIGFLTSDAAISSIGVCLGRGTIISIAMVMGLLPQLLVIGDKIIEKTSFKVRTPLQKVKTGGRVAVDGAVHGTVSGRIDGIFTGVILGDFDGGVTGNVREENADENASNVPCIQTDPGAAIDESQQNEGGEKA